MMDRVRRRIAELERELVQDERLETETVQRTARRQQAVEVRPVCPVCCVLTVV